MSYHPQGVEYPGDVTVVVVEALEEVDVNYRAARERFISSPAFHCFRGGWSAPKIAVAV